MKKYFKLLLASMLLLCSGCHGKRTTSSFAMPASFDT